MLRRSAGVVMVVCGVFFLCPAFFQARLLSSAHLEGTVVYFAPVADWTTFEQVGPIFDVHGVGQEGFHRRVPLSANFRWRSSASVKKSMGRCSAIWGRNRQVLWNSAWV